MMNRIKVAELMRKEGIQGKVIKLFPSWHTGIIHGEEGTDVTFGEDSLVAGFSYSELCLGLCVSYSFSFATGAKVPTAVNLEPAHAHKAKGSTEFANKLGSQNVA
jgi:hypothetical protein